MSQLPVMTGHPLVLAVSRLVAVWVMVVGLWRDGGMARVWACWRLHRNGKALAQAYTLIEREDQLHQDMVSQLATELRAQQRALHVAHMAYQATAPQEAPWQR